jgi:hypothetical protein
MNNLIDDPTGPVLVFVGLFLLLILVLIVTNWRPILRFLLYCVLLIAIGAGLYLWVSTHATGGH